MCKRRAGVSSLGSARCIGALHASPTRMTDNATGTLWRNENRAYAVVTQQDASGKPVRSGLSHVQAMTLAEELRRSGHVATVMHVIGNKSYEVDRYPSR
jgi:hypothetical protein